MPQWMVAGLNSLRGLEGRTQAPSELHDSGNITRLNIYDELSCGNEGSDGIIAVNPRTIISFNHAVQVTAGTVKNLDVQTQIFPKSGPDTVVGFVCDSLFFGNPVPESVNPALGIFYVRKGNSETEVRPAGFLHIVTGKNETVTQFGHRVHAQAVLVHRRSTLVAGHAVGLPSVNIMLQEEGMEGITERVNLTEEIGVIRKEGIELLLVLCCGSHVFIVP